VVDSIAMCASSDPERDDRPLRAPLVALAVLIGLFAVSASAAEIRCRVVNGTTGRPCSPESAAVVELSGGMKTVGSLTDPGSSFVFQGLDREKQYLLQVVHAGVRYNSMLVFGASDIFDSPVTVYDISDDDSHIALRSVRVAMRIEGDRLTASMTFDIRNDGKRVFSAGSRGSFRFTLPDGFQQVESLTATTIGMPAPQAAIPTGRPSELAVGYPIKPGETRVEALAGAPYPGEFTYRQRFHYPLDRVVVTVDPASVSVSSAHLQPAAVGEGKAVEYTGGPLARDGQLEFRLTGAAPAVEGTGSASESQVVELAPPLYRHRSRILLLMITVMSLAFWYGMRETGARSRKRR